MMNRSHWGFTIIELLVVVTVIVVLLALLAPAMDKAMEAAMRASCQARMRALNTAVHLYAIDSNRWLPQWLARKEQTVNGVGTGAMVTDATTFWWWVLTREQYTYGS